MTNGSFDAVSDGSLNLEVTARYGTFDFPVPCADFETDNVATPVVAEYEEEGLRVRIEVYLDRVDYVIDAEDIESVSLLESAPAEPPAVFMPVYVPFVKYTDAAKGIVRVVAAESEKRTMFPLIDIRKLSNVEKYLDDRIDTPHFLDLCGLRYVANESEREEIKERRRRYKKRHRTMDGAPEIPESHEVPMSREEIAGVFQTLPTDNIVPVWRIDTEKAADLQFASVIRELSSRFGSVALRAMPSERFAEHIESYLLPISDALENHYVLIECSEQRGSDIQKVDRLKTIAPGLQIVYVRETTDFERYTVLLNRPNLFPNVALSIYSEISQRHQDVWFGDYMGYDRDTAVEFVPGMKPSASLYLLSSDATELEVLKVKVEAEKGTSKWRKSMRALLNYVQEGHVDPRFVSPNHCAGCKMIFGAEKMTLRDAKIASQIHNAVTVMRC